jgi:hypothetical protein
MRGAQLQQVRRTAARALLLGTCGALLVCCGGSSAHSTRHAAAKNPKSHKATKALAPQLVHVGPGVAESSVRQVIRTPKQRVYIVAVDDDRLRNPGQYMRLRMYRARQAGIPKSFAEVDQADAPAAGGTGSGRPYFSGVDARLDRAGIIHMAYFRTDGEQVVYQTFSTITNRWGPAETVATIYSSGGTAENDIDGLFGTRGLTVVALTLDANEQPVIAATSSFWVRAYSRVNGSWTVDPEINEFPAWHPSITRDRVGGLHLAWLDTSGHQDRIRYAYRSPAGVWSAPQTVAGSGVLGEASNDNLDQSPSVAVNSHNQPVITWLTTQEFVRVSTLVNGEWISENPSPNVFAHNPGVGIEGNQLFAVLGHDVNIHPAYLTLTEGASSWSSTTVLRPPRGVSKWEYDGSASTRFDPDFDTDRHVIDAVFFDENSDARGGAAREYRPDLYYAALPVGRGPAR